MPLNVAGRRALFAGSSTGLERSADRSELSVLCLRVSARAAKSKLTELASLLSDVDEEHEPYPVYLPRTFVCGTVFFAVDPAAERQATAGCWRGSRGKNPVPSPWPAT